jgi:hypothetical protein
VLESMSTLVGFDVADISAIHGGTTTRFGAQFYAGGGLVFA